MEESIENPEDEFVRFYTAHWAKLVAALAWAVPPGEDPRDVAQEAMARAFEHWGRVRRHERPDAWLFVTGYRLASSLRRRLSVRRRHGGTTPAVRDEFEQLVLDEALSGMVPKERAVLLLRHHYGFSTAETARVLRCPEGTVKSMSSRARAALREQLQIDEEVEG